MIRPFRAVLSRSRRGSNKTVLNRVPPDFPTILESPVDVMGCRFPDIQGSVVLEGNTLAIREQLK